MIIGFKRERVHARLIISTIKAFRKMGWMSSEVNTVLISSLLAIIGAGVPLIIAWLRAKTKQLNEIALQTKQMADANHELLAKNTQISKNIERQTDGINKKMVKIAEIVAFTKGRIKGRAEGESDEPYEELERLENQLKSIGDIDFALPKKPRLPK